MNTEARNTEDWKVLSHKIGEVIQKALREKKMTVQAFAKEMGFSQPAVSSVLNPKMPNRCWSGPMLLAAARVLKIGVSDIFLAVEKEEGLDAFLVSVFLGDRPPRSDERLAGLIHWAAPRGTPEETKKTFYTVAMMQTFFSDLVEDYHMGKISDSQMLCLFRAALNAAEGESNLWTALKSYRSISGTEC